MLEVAVEIDAKSILFKIGLMLEAIIELKSVGATQFEIVLFTV